MTRFPFVRFLAAFAGLAAFALFAAGCVIGRQARPSSTESAHGASGAPVSGSPVVPRISAENAEIPSPAKPPTPNSSWIQGYWHWDGVRYIWQRGHWEPS